MTYTQYTTSPITGYDEATKNRIDSNSNSPRSEAIQYPTRFDLFVNKENSSIGAFAVTEEHTLSQLAGSTLYLDHRPASDTTGGITPFVVSNGGVVDTTQTDIYQSSIQFSTLPSAATFTVSYSAAPDKVQDSHINAMQNILMSIQGVLGIKAVINGQGTGLISMPLVVNARPSTLANYQQLQSIIPGIVLPSHLQSDFFLSSTDVVGIPGYGTGVYIYIGQTGAGAGKDNVWIDANNFTVATTNGLAGNPGGTYRLGLTTGDRVGMSGCLTVASQTTIGLTGGACGTFQGVVPTGAGAFYSGAMLRVHGGIWFGSGLSGNGSVVFITTTGQAVTVSGALQATTLDVSGPSQFHDLSIFNNILSVTSPGYFVTNNDIVLNDKPNFTPAKIDGLDPSYAAYVNNYGASTPIIAQSTRHDIAVSHTRPYVSGAKLHPLYGHQMYPIIGGWTYTGTVRFESAEVSGNRNILLLGANLPAFGNNSTIASVAVNLGGGTAATGHYSSGLFNPGDTFIEIKGASTNDAYSYPIYYHQAFVSGSSLLTGLNVYVAADDAALSTSIAGKQYRIYQPGNVPLLHCSGNWVGASATPTAVFGQAASTDYPNSFASVTLDKPWLGGQNVTNYGFQHKRSFGNGVTAVTIKEALEKSINNITGAAISATGVAYIYVVGSDTNSTVENNIQLRASPTPWGVASSLVQLGSPKLLPGQHLPVGEVLATTTNGTTWTHLESVSYRDKGFYDSCWIPLVDYKKTLIPSDFGRCLPFWSATTQSDSSDDSGYYMFYVEHNLGPILTQTDIEYRIFVATHGTQNFDTNPSAPGVGQATELKLSAIGSQNLWTPYSSNYVAGHSFATTTASTRGFVRDLTQRFQLTYCDTRFAKLVWDSQVSNVTDANTFRGAGSRLAGYIRVIMRRVR